KTDESKLKENGKSPSEPESGAAKEGEKKNDSADAAKGNATKGPNSPADATSRDQRSPITREELLEELFRAWELRDVLASGDFDRIRPVDYAPHLWRELEQRLLALDRTLRN